MASIINARSPPSPRSLGVPINAGAEEIDFDCLDRHQSESELAIAYRTPRASPQTESRPETSPVKSRETSSLYLKSDAITIALLSSQPQAQFLAAPVSPPITPPLSISSMSGYYYPYSGSRGVQQEEDEDEQEQHQQYTVPYSAIYATYTASPQPSVPVHSYHQQPQHRYYIDPQQTFRSQSQYTAPPTSQFQYTAPSAMSQQSTWTPMPYAPQQTAPLSMYGYPGYAPQDISPSFPQYTDHMASLYPGSTSAASSAYLGLPVAGPSQSRVHRAASIASRASSISYNTDNSRSASPNAIEMAKWGFRLPDGRWKCRYPDCTSLSTFSRGCDLRKHYKRHTKTLFCRYRDCPQSSSGGFSSKKDRLRHEASHNPEILCEWTGCDRKFSRVDNMKDHVKRVHLKHDTGH